MKVPNKKSPAPLRTSAWAFDKTPDWQVRFCVNYEYARESKEFRLRVDEIRARKPRPPGSPFDVTRMEFTGPQTWVLNTVLARSVPEFPDIPWLDFSEDRRTQLLVGVGITELSGCYSHGFIDRGHPATFFKALRKETVGCIDENASFVLEFDFTEQDDFITKGFSAWLKATRDALLALDGSEDSPYRATKIRRGKSGNLSVYRQALTDLSALRRQRAGGPILKSDTEDPKVEKKMIRRAEELIAHFSQWGTTQKLGFVESLLEKSLLYQGPPR